MKNLRFVVFGLAALSAVNRSTTEALHLVIFYVSDPDTPFLDPLN